MGERLDVRLISFFAASLLALFASGCASSTTSDGISDPLEPINRQIFAFNHSLDKHAALPAASYYKAAMPGGVREGVHNFLSNLSEPVTFANDVLQGQPARAGMSACRFGVNTTIGVIGVLDPATDMGCVQHEEDFGQTLGVYGVPGGPYLVLPFLGSSLPRDAFGKIVVDHFFSPVGYVSYNGKIYVTLVQTALSTVDSRSRAINAVRDIERNSIDYYAAMRSIYIQRRESQIRNDQANSVTTPFDAPKP